MNTSLEPFCFWCGGNARYEFSTEPRPFYPDRQQMCASCASLRKDGILLFEMIETDPGCGNPYTMHGGAFYTGRWVVIDDCAAAQMFPPEVLPMVLAARISGLKAEKYAAAGFTKHPWRTIQ